MTLLEIVWNVDPIIFQFTDGGFGPRWYSLMFIISFILGYRILGKMYKHAGAPEDWLDGAFFYTFIGVIIGARLGHVFFYDWASYSQDPIKILYIWEGGLASHGALIGVLVGLYLLWRKSKGATFLWILDRVVVTIALAAGFVRLGNLMNSEIYGHVTDLPWGFVFAQDGQTLPRHPTQIYEAICYFILFAVLYSAYWRRKGEVRDGRLFGIFLVGLFTARFFVEFVKENQVGFEEDMALNMGQLLSILPIAVGLYFALRKQAPISKLVNPEPYGKKAK